jgi:hypothetical protein
MAQTSTTRTPEGAANERAPPKSRDRKVGTPSKER